MACMVKNTKEPARDCFMQKARKSSLKNWEFDILKDTVKQMNFYTGPTGHDSTWNHAL